MKMNLKKVFILGDSKGFTLIELLVVVAIIGILASIVLASLNTARDKGSDAAVKANLSNMRAQAALYYDDNGNTYGIDEEGNGLSCIVNPDGTTVPEAGCAGLFIDPQMMAAMKATATASGGAVYSSTDDSGENWAASAGLKSTTDVTFCVDGEGKANTNLTAVAGLCI